MIGKRSMQADTLARFKKKSVSGRQGMYWIKVLGVREAQHAGGHLGELQEEVGVWSAGHVLIKGLGIREAQLRADSIAGSLKNTVSGRQRMYRRKDLDVKNAACGRAPWPGPGKSQCLAGRACPEIQGLGVIEAQHAGGHLGQVREEVGVWPAGHVLDAAKAAPLLVAAGHAHDDRRVHIHRVAGVLRSPEPFNSRPGSD